MRTLLALCVVASLAGCATQPISFAEAKPVDASKIVDVGSGDAVVMIKRDTGMLGAACDAKVLINGKLRVRLSPGEAVTLRSPAGPTILSTTACGGSLREISAVLYAGVENKFRVLVGSQGMDISPTATK